jgi:hypothetical protein
MEVLSQRCGGLDVHQRTVVACLRLHEGKGEARQELRTFETVTAALLILSDWLTAQGVTHVAMESTGVYVRRITARAISLVEGTGSGGHPWVGDSPWRRKPKDYLCL